MTNKLTRAEFYGNMDWFDVDDDIDDVDFPSAFIEAKHLWAESADNKAELSKENFSIFDLKNKLNKQSELGLEAEEWFLNWKKIGSLGMCFLI